MTPTEHIEPGDPRFGWGTTPEQYDTLRGLLVQVQHDIEAEGQRGDLTTLEWGLYESTIEAMLNIISIRRLNLRFPDEDDDPGEDDAEEND